LRRWVQQEETDTGCRDGVTSEERARIKDMEREVWELRQANEILKKGEPMERQWSEKHWRTRILPRRNSTAHSNDDRVHRRLPGRVWGQADLPGSADRPSTFYEHKAIERDPVRPSDRAKLDEVLRREVQHVWDQNFKVYGVRKVWHKMRREGFDVARCELERLMQQLGITPPHITRYSA